MYEENELRHHGVLGQRWGVIHEKKTKPKTNGNSVFKTVATHWPGKIGTLSRAIYNTKDDAKNYWDSRSQYEYPTKQSIAGKAIKGVYDIYKPVKKEYDKVVYTSGRKVNQGISDINKKMRDSNTFIGSCAKELLPDLFNDQSKINDGTDYLNKINDYLNTPLLAIYDGSKYLWKKSGEGAEEYNSHAKERKNPANLMLFGSGRPRVREKK